MEKLVNGDGVVANRLTEQETELLLELELLEEGDYAYRVEGAGVRTGKELRASGFTEPDRIYGQDDIALESFIFRDVEYFRDELELELDELYNKEDVTFSDSSYDNTIMINDMRTFLQDNEQIEIMSVTVDGELLVVGDSVRTDSFGELEFTVLGFDTKEGVIQTVVELRNSTKADPGVVFVADDGKSVLEGDTYYRVMTEGADQGRISYHTAMTGMGETEGCLRYTTLDAADEVSLLYSRVLCIDDISNASEGGQPFKDLREMVLNRTM